MFNSSYGFAPLTFLAAFSGIYCMLLFSQWFHFGMVEYIGKNSMLYFAWHQSILMPLLRDFYMAIGIPALLSVSQKYALILISVVLILLVLTAADKWIRNSGLSFMLGVR